MASKKDHDLLDTKAAVMAAIRWELGRFARRMQESAYRIVEEKVADAIKEGRTINALEISEVAVNQAKQDFVGGSAAPRKRLSPKR